METLFFEPKVLYRSSVEEVPIEPYEIALGSAEVVREGKDITCISYGPQIK
ncbi:hypothetical protein T484DRAFT_1799024, partial [Baffinella frigidus]